MSYKKRILFLNLVDAVVIAAAVMLAYFLRFDFQLVPKYFGLVPYVILTHIILILITFNWVKMYRRMWQYASIGEMVQLVKAVTIPEIAFFNHINVHT